LHKKYLPNSLLVTSLSLILIYTGIGFILGLELTITLALSLIAIVSLLVFNFLQVTKSSSIKNISDLLLQRISAHDNHLELDKNFASISSSVNCSSLNELWTQLGKLADTTQDLAIHSSHNAISAAEVSYSVSELKDKMSHQTGEIDQISSAIQQITQNSEEVSQNSTAAMSQARDASNNSSKGQSVLSTAMNKISSILEKSNHTSHQIQRLSENSEKIRDVTHVIESIANQTNLLALNAAIEAARAGEMGRGFAVVADEVRSLAARTAEATTQVGQIIEDTHAETRDVVEVVNELSSEVTEGAEFIKDAEQRLQQVGNMVDGVDSQITQIANKAEENHDYILQITQSIQNIGIGVRNSNDHVSKLDIEAEKFTDIAEETNAALASVLSEGIHQQVYGIACLAAEKIQHCFEDSIAANEIRESDIFDRNHQLVEATNPKKYRTGYDDYADRVLPDIQEPILTANEFIAYAIATDDKAYVPTHNKKFCQPLSGDYDTDLLANRTKRKFTDKTGSRCGSHTKKLLLQTYKRDTGEIMHDLSVPIYIRGKHWGGFRVGYFS